MTATTTEVLAGPVIEDTTVRRRRLAAGRPVAEAASSLGAASDDETDAEPGARLPKYSAFTQQEMWACRPVLTPAWVVGILVAVAVVFLPLGGVALAASRAVVEVSYRYDECLLETPAGLEGVSPLAQLEAAGPEGVPCSWTFEVPRDMEGPVFVYAEIDGMYQNNRRYVQSRSDAQLRGEATEEIKYKKIKECRPELYTDPLLDPDTADPDVVAAETIVPCGLVASSLFNDDYSVRVGEPDAEISIPLSVENIAWPSDKTRRFGDIPAQNSAAVPDGMPLNADERLIVWMRSATLSRFRKLWGILDVDLAEGDRVTVDIASRFDTYSFDGAKSVVLSTAGWMGGAGHVTGLLCIAVGLVSLFAAGGFALLVFLTPRTTGDLSHLSWNQEAAAAARAAAGGN